MRSRWRWALDADDDRSLVVDPARPAGPGGTVASVLAAVAFGAVMVLALGNLLFGLFALLSPVMVLGNWCESRHRRRRAGRRESRRYRAAVERFAVEAAAARRVEVRRRRAALPDAAEVVRRASLPSVSLWERRPGAHDFLRLAAGSGELPWRPALACSGEPPPEVAGVLDRLDRLPPVPVPVELAGGGVVGIVGDRTPAVAVARSLVCQAPSTTARPTSPSPSSPPPSGPANGAGPSGCRTPGTPTPAAAPVCWPPPRRTSTLCCGTSWTRARPGPSASSWSTPTGSPTAATRRPGLCCGAAPSPASSSPPPRDRLPALCTTVVTLHGPDGEASLRRPQAGELVERFLAAGLDVPTARRCALALARFDDPELATPGAGLPDAVGLLDLLGSGAVDAESVLDRWRAAGAAPAVP